MNLLTPFKSLKYRAIACLYFAETVSLLGDACTWLGLALLSYDIAGNESAKILATALTFRVVYFVIFAPFGGVLADRFDRKNILYITHFSRMAVVGCLPFRCAGIYKLS